MKLPNIVYTKFCLSQMTNEFPDFKTKEFSEISKKIYGEVYQLVQKNNKLGLIKLLTPPNVEIIKIAHKHNQKLPFGVYETVNKSQIVYARFSKDSDENSATVNFAHITMKMDCLDENGKEKIQLNIFERRLDSKLKDSWRISFIEDIS